VVLYVRRVREVHRQYDRELVTADLVQHLVLVAVAHDRGREGELARDPRDARIGVRVLRLEEDALASEDGLRRVERRRHRRPLEAPGITLPAILPGPLPRRILEGLPDEGDDAHERARIDVARRGLEGHVRRDIGDEDRPRGVVAREVDERAPAAGGAARGDRAWGG